MRRDVIRCGRVRFVCVVVTVLAGFSLAVSADAEEAERQYRVGRRLAIEGSPEAVQALRRVIELDPAGPLADDARVDLARYFGAPDWPEGLGRISESDLSTARALLDKVVADPRSDRAAEARYYRGLLLLEPFSGRSESAARLALVDVATQPGAGEWVARARYARAVLDEREGDASAAGAAFQRVLVDDPGSRVASRARVGLARLALIGGDPGRSAAWAQEAIDEGVGDDLGAAAVREAAVRGLVEAGSGEALRLLAPGLGIRVPTTMFGAHDGGVVLGGRKTGVVLRLDAGGRVSQRWTVERLSALAVSPGAVNVFAATDEQIVVLAADADGPARRIADLGDFATPLALAADGTGRFWVLDRKGQQVGRVDADQQRAVPLGPALEAKLSTLVWDRGRLLGIDTKSGALVAINFNGQLTRLSSQTVGKALDLAVAPDGSIGVLDGKLGVVALFDRAGASLATRSIKGLGPIKPVGIDFGPDGALMLFDGSNAAWWRSP